MNMILPHADTLVRSWASGRRLLAVLAAVSCLGIAVPKAATDDPVSVTFTILSTCGSGSSYEGKVGPTSAGSVGGDGDCTCSPPLRTVTSADPGLLAAVGAPACTDVSVLMTGSSYVSWVRADITRTESGVETFCLHDTAGGNCTEGNLCSAGYEWVTDASFSGGSPDIDGDGLNACVDPDIDGDGVLNGADNCPVNANADQADADSNGVGDACAGAYMMPERDARTTTPVVVWGATRQANGTAFTLDYGDGSPAEVGVVVDRSYIAFPHTYATQGAFTATLTVGPEVATTTVQVFDPAAMAGGATGDANRNLGINMAIEDGLRSLWVSQANRAGNFPDGVTTNWSNSFSYADTSLIVLAFENHGYALTGNDPPTGIYESFIVRRGLNYVMQSLSSVTLGVTPQGDDPCVGSGTGWSGADCIGLTTPPGDGHAGYGTAVAILPFAASGALSRVNSEAGGATAGMTFGEILQRLANTEAWGQTDGVGATERGGFGYNHNGGQFDGSTAGWAVLGFLDAAAAGATVPAWVKTEFKFGFDNTLNDDGSFDYSADANPAGPSNPGPAKVGIGLQGLFFTGELAGARVDAVKANINSWWPDAVPYGIGGNAWGGHDNHGGAYAMFNMFKGLKLQGISLLPDVNRSTRPWAFLGTGADDDWHADYKDWLVFNQVAPDTVNGGSWGPPMSFSCCYSGDAIETAIAELLLSAVALVLPDEDKFGAFGLSPATADNPVGTQHTVIAHAETTSGSPVPGATVDFKVISGPNAGATGQAVTGADGNASFTYPDLAGTGGQDVIQAFIGDIGSNTVVKNWILVQPFAGRMTGGGSVFTKKNERVTHGFTLHCNPNSLPNNLEVNWGKGNNFKLTALTSVVCSDDPAIVPTPPSAGFDTYVATGTGKYNGVAGATISFTFTDAGEPGKKDTATMVIKDAGGATVQTVSGNLNSGNQQAHKE